MISWGRAVVACWSYSWRSYGGTLALAAVVVFIYWLWAVVRGLPMPHSPDELPGLLAVPLSIGVLAGEIGLMLWAMRRAVEKNLPALSRPLSWGRVLLACWQWAWRTVVLFVVGGLLYVVLLKLTESIAPKGLKRLGLVSFVLWLVWSVFGTQIIAMRETLKVQLRQQSPVSG